jgi:methanogenic corrinoid protein MtbC1
MATSKSTGGSFMSQYDKEVEKRLQALEEKAHTPCGGAGAPVSEDLATKIEELWGWYQSVRSRV